MKKIFLLLLFSNSFFAQEITVKFKFYVNKSVDLAAENKNFTLHQNTDFSVFELDDIKDANNFKHKEYTSVLKERDTMTIFTFNNEGFLCLYQEKNFKDFKNNYQIYNYLMDFKCQYVKDKIDMFNWEIINENDTLIANYHCKKALTKFRGREYIAYYTNEIANQGGPWKFDGLPGFILNVVSKDGYLRIEPTEIKLNKNNKEIKNPFLNKKTILFEEIAGKIIEGEKKRFAIAKSKPNPPDKMTIGPSESIEDLGLKVRVYE